MQYMLMMHVGHDDGTEVLDWAPQDVKNMIEFQRAFDRELEESGEMVFNAGLSWPDQARIVRYDHGAPAVTDGPFPEAKQFLIGFWVVDCDSEERAYAIAAKASSSPGPGGGCRRASRSRCARSPAHLRWTPDRRRPGVQARYRPPRSAGGDPARSQPRRPRLEEGTAPAVRRRR